MIYVGIDVAKKKHDCCILTSDGEKNTFTITNNMDGFTHLLEKILAAEEDHSNVKVGLESTGHYSYNILKFLLNFGFTTYVLNPLFAKEYRKCLLHRSTKTDKVDAYILADMVMSGRNLKPYCLALYHNEDLKSLTRYKFSLVKKRSLEKVSFSRLVNIVFPELEDLFRNIHTSTVTALLYEYPSAESIASANLTRLTNIIKTASCGRFSKDKAIEIRNLAKHSVGSGSPASSFELRQVIESIEYWDEKIEKAEAEIEKYCGEDEEILCSIPGMSKMAAAAIVAEIGDIEKFERPDQLVAYSGISPSTYQSGQKENKHARMEKKGSKYLRYHLFITAKQMTMANPKSKEYLDRKVDEGKHYYVAISHLMKKLIRLIFAMLKKRSRYLEAA